MKIFFTVIFGALAVILLCTVIFAGFKALFLNLVQKVKSFFTGQPIKRDNTKTSPDGKTGPGGFLNVIGITSGKCDKCGRTYIGTTEDRHSSLNEVTFMGEKRILCDDCLHKIMDEFNQTSPTDETLYSESAQKLKKLFVNIGNPKK